LLQYGDTAVRRAVPLALAAAHLSDPEYTVVDLLSRLSHDHNEDCAQAAILGLGLVGAGTNNSRIAALLRALADFYKTEPNTRFVVRLAQGLLHCGKVRRFLLARARPHAAFPGARAVFVCSLLTHPPPPPPAHTHTTTNAFRAS
jgi:hypothetical protein